MGSQSEPNFERAMLDAYCCLVRVLDKSGNIRMQDVMDALSNAAEVRRRDGDTEESEALHRLRNKLMEEARVGHPPLRGKVG